MFENVLSEHLLVCAAVILPALLVAGWFVYVRVPTFPWRFRCRVSRVCDGDTVWVRTRYGRRLKLRLAGIDAPDGRTGRSDATILSAGRLVFKPPC